MHTRCKPEAWCIVSLHSEGRHGAPVAIIIIYYYYYHSSYKALPPGQETDGLLFHSTERRVV
jgi:hypothetical protein